MPLVPSLVSTLPGPSGLQIKLFEWNLNFGCTLSMGENIFFHLLA